MIIGRMAQADEARRIRAVARERSWNKSESMEQTSTNDPWMYEYKEAVATMTEEPSICIKHRSYQRKVTTLQHHCHRHHSLQTQLYLLVEVLLEYSMSPPRRKAGRSVPSFPQHPLAWTKQITRS